MRLQEGVLAGAGDAVQAGADVARDIDCGQAHTVARALSRSSRAAADAVVWAPRRFIRTDAVLATYPTCRLTAKVRQRSIPLSLEWGVGACRGT